MELRHLRYFLAVERERNFSRAAKSLNIVQSALSMQVRDLEEELGAPLFSRTSRRVDLTEAGALLKVEAERTLAQAERARDIVAKAAKGEIGSLRVGFTGNAAITGKLSNDLRMFHERFPAVEINLREIAPIYQAKALLEGELDIGYIHSFGSAFETQVATFVLDSWPWVLAVSSFHPLASRKTVSPDLLLGQDFILYAASGMDHGQLVTLHKLIGCEPNVVARVTNTMTMFSLVSANLGVALVPAPLAELGMPNLEFIKVTRCKDSTTLILLSRKEEVGGAVGAFRKIATRRSAKSEAKA